MSINRYATTTAKDERHIAFDTTFRDQAGNTYELASVAVHIGESLQTGHWVTYAKMEGNWWLLDDAVASRVEESHVLDKQATMLVYVRGGYTANVPTAMETTQGYDPPRDTTGT
jgi:ubiquitin C-terminal hydrolase